jgi:dolichol-phosphate mannosyltransferase
MARVSLVLPTTPQIPLSPERVHSFQRDLEDAGHSVEVVVVSPADAAPAEGFDPLWRRVETGQLGLAAVATEGLRAASGDLLVVLDPSMGYASADLSRVLEPLASGEADLAIASRFASGAAGSAGVTRSWLRTCTGAVLRPMTGTSDPLSGLLALTRASFEREADALRPVGTKFAIELLLRTEGRCVEVPVQGRWPAGALGLRFDDLRQVKRLADHRFGNYSRLAQFCVVGASGMVVDLTCYAAFQRLFKMTALAHQTTPFFHTSMAVTVSAVLSVWVALTWNFSGNRRFTFSYARRGSLMRQYVTYAFSNSLGNGVSLFLRLMLPGLHPFFNAHKLAAAVVGIVAGTGISFSMTRWVVFRHEAASPPQSPMLEELDPVAAGPLGD